MFSVFSEIGYVATLSPATLKHVLSLVSYSDTDLVHLIDNVLYSQTQFGSTSTLFPSLYADHWNISLFLHIVTIDHLDYLLTNSLNRVDLMCQLAVGEWIQSTKVIPEKNSPLNNLELVDNMFRNCKNKNIQNLLETASDKDCLVIGIAILKRKILQIEKEMFYRLFAGFIIARNAVLTRVWGLREDWVIEAIVSLYNGDTSTIGKILEVVQDLKALSRILDINSYAFTIDLATMASRREYLNLEKWLAEKIKKDTPDQYFTSSCINFLAIKTPQVSPEILDIFIRSIQAVQNLSPENSSALRRLTSYPRNAPSLADDESVGATPIPDQTFAPDVEKEANSFFLRIYKGEIRIAQLIELLLLYKASSIRREVDVCNCIVNSLFDEYKFFSRYPEKELGLTSILFGSLIQNGIVSGMAMGNALRYVLEAVRLDATNPLFGFGLQALHQFQARLPEWPQYCLLLLQIPHFEQSSPEIAQLIKQRQILEVQVEPYADGSSSLFESIRPDAIDSSQNFHLPQEQIQDRIMFIINNVSSQNLESKLDEMKGLFQREYSRWLSAYVVSKRVSIEPNYHSLYITFLGGLECKELDRFLLAETYEAIHALIVSPKTVTSSEERTLLKNLGMWLGGITLVRNLPIKRKNLAIKELLLEGYDTERLIVVIPFVCKVLEQCMNSVVFKPPNPWLMAVMRVMSELYHFADLKLNLKFEIEVLCKKIKLDVKGLHICNMLDIKPTKLLKSRPSKGGNSESTQMAKNFERLAIAPSTVSAPPGGLISAGSGSSTPIYAKIPVVEEPAGYPNIAQYITFHASLPILQTQPALKRLICAAIDRAIREIINPVVERSVTIAGIATRELVVKDFALEPNEDKMRKAAHLMVQHLSGSLASVTSREPLRMSMIQHIKTLLTQNNLDAAISEAGIVLLVGDNLELACSIVEKTAAEKAVAEIDEGLAMNFINRRKHREPFYDLTVYSSSRYPSTLPESLRLRPNGLTNAQLRVYEDFARLPRMVVQEPVPEEPMQTPEAVEKFTQYLVELEILFPQMDVGSVTALPPQHEIHVIIHHAPLIVNQSYQRDEVALILSQRIISLLFKHAQQLPLETYVLLLERICETSKKVSKEVFNWLLFNDDERKYNLATFVTILQARLLSISELDMQLARLIDAGRVSVIEFTQKLMRRCIMEAPVLGSQNDFFNCIDMFTKLYIRGKASDSVISLVEDLRKMNRQDIFDRLDEADPKAQLSAMFAEWAQLFHHPSSTEKSQIKHVNQMIGQGVLKTDDISSLFFRVCTEQSIELYLKNKAAGGPPVFAFKAIDAFARLTIMFVKQYSDVSQSSSVGKINLLNKILSVIVLVLVNLHENLRGQFNQRPVFRLFASLLNDINIYEHSLKAVSFQILCAISNTLHTIQPSFLPGFTFSWLQLISNRHFMAKMLNSENQKGWPFIQRLIVDLFKFMAPYLRVREFSDPVRLLYRGTLRVLLILLHDFPEFLCCYHFSFMDVIPSQCVQLRNLVLSAFPIGMKLPDPFTLNVNNPLLPEMKISPQILSDFTSSLSHGNLKQDLDQYLKTRGPASILMNLCGRLTIAQPEVGGLKYVVQMINSLVLYVGMHATTQMPKTPSMQIQPSASLDVFMQLSNEFDTEGRYFFLCAIANHLRYPNSHTHYFSQLMLHMFAEAKQEVIQEQITRVLLERLIVNRPHPHGLLVTFIELIRNPRFNFWEHIRFIRCSPEIEKLFTSVAKSINMSFGGATRIE